MRMNDEFYSVDVWGNTVVLLNCIGIAVLKVPVGRLSPAHQQEVLNQVGFVRDCLNEKMETITELEKERDYYERSHCEKHNLWNNTLVDFLQYKQKVREILQKEYSVAKEMAKPIDSISYGDDKGYWNGVKEVIERITDELGVDLE